MTESSDPQTPEVVAFAHAIRHAISESDGWDEFPYSLNLDQMVADVLATPEMQAIKASFNDKYVRALSDRPDMQRAWLRGSRGLTNEALIEWVLS